MSSPTSSSIQTRRITMRDVAELSGVNQASVSVVLNGAKSGGGVSEATRARIIKAAEELGYRRNNSAANMKSGRSGWISLVMVPNLPLSALNEGLMMGVSAELAQHGLHLHVESVSMKALYNEDLWPCALREWMSDGVIMAYQKQETPELEAIIQRHRIPVIWTNAQREADCIYPDDESAFSGATQTLLELGHRHITYINNGSTEHYSRQARQSGYERAMQAAGLGAEVLEGLAACRFDPRIQAIRSLCSRPASQRPTAVLCYAPGDALTLWAAAMAAGLRVPEDMSIVAANTHMHTLDGRRLSGVTVPFQAVGSGAVRMLMQKIENPECKLPPQAVPFRPVQGDTHIKQRVPSH